MGLSKNRGLNPQGGFKSWDCGWYNHLPSGKRLHSYGKSLFLMGKSTINGPCSIAMLVYQRVV